MFEYHALIKTNYYIPYSIWHLNLTSVPNFRTKTLLRELNIIKIWSSKNNIMDHTRFKWLIMPRIQKTPISVIIQWRYPFIGPKNMQFSRFSNPSNQTHSHCTKPVVQTNLHTRGITYIFGSGMKSTFTWAMSYEWIPGLT